MFELTTCVTMCQKCGGGECGTNIRDRESNTSRYRFIVNSRQSRNRQQPNSENFLSAAFFLRLYFFLNSY